MYLEKYDILKDAEAGATFLLNAPYAKEEVWQLLPKNIRQQIENKKLKFYVVNASQVARETGMGSRINTILQTCFFAISNILPREEAIQRIKDAILKSYGSKGEAVVQKNYEAVDKAVSSLFEIDYSALPVGTNKSEDAIHGNAPDFVQNVLGRIIAGEGDELPVSAFPVDGTYITGTTQWEKRNIAEQVPVWDEELCSQCGKCFLVCPHAAIPSQCWLFRFLPVIANAIVRYITLLDHTLPFHPPSACTRHRIQCAGGAPTESIWAWSGAGGQRGDSQGPCNWPCYLDDTP